MKTKRGKIAPVPKENCGNPADVARLKGWTVGTKLIGDEGWGPTVIKITAIGEEEVLARKLSHNGEPVDCDEGTWEFSCRDWKVMVGNG